jgi:dihydrofolate reductase
VLTHEPEKYSQDQLPGQLEFSSESPKELVQRLQGAYQEMLLVGGGQTNATFIEDGVLNELYLTIEPKLFGKGKLVVGEGDFFVQARLQSVKQLNEQGTLLLHYTLKYE